MKDSSRLEVDIKTLGYYIDRALCAMIKRLNKELKAQNLNFQHSDFAILMVLSQKDGLNQSELAGILGKEKSGIGRSLLSLEKDGYIARKAVNGCTNEVVLTEKGIEIMPLLNSIAHKVTDIAFAGLSESKRKEMLKNLTIVYKNSLK